MDGVIPPAVVQAVHQVAHPAVLLAGEQVQSGQLLVEGLEVGEQLLAASTAVSSWRQTFAQWLTSSQQGFRK
jgi:hypothetical protein